ncbi:MAG: Long-chain fatty acid transport protein [Myxococcales bacterium]|nr:Long-chain fatty acid transport protein [Myxococcales bacterium]
MKLGAWMAMAALCGAVGSIDDATAGGLFLPGSGAVSTSRAGAAVASTSDGEALGLNPAGLAKSTGTTITLSMAIIDYAMRFSRRGQYDYIDNDDQAWEGRAYPVVEQDAKPPLALGSYQPVPVFAITTDLGGAVPGLTIGAGVYAPNSYPFRELCTRTSNGCERYEFNVDVDQAPSPARYDIVSQDAVLFMPSFAASYRVVPELDIGARVGIGFAHLKSEINVWSSPGNVVENVKKDGLFSVDVKDNFVPGFGFGVAYRPTPYLEIGANYTSSLTLDAKGNAHAELGSEAGATGVDVEVGPVDDEAARCAPGGTTARQAACVTLEIPQTATIGARYKFLDAAGVEKGDIELNLGWENWGAERATDFLVVIDAQLLVNGTPSLSLKDNIVSHGFQDTFSARLGGSYRFPVGESTVIARGGVGYDTAAAKPGWLRADIDGAARTTVTVGAGYRTKRFEINIGGGAVLEGTNDNEGECNPTSSLPSMLGCNGDGVEDPIEDRRGPDPINPLNNPDAQLQAPVNHGVFKSHYVLFMLGASTWF